MKKDIKLINNEEIKEIFTNDKAKFVKIQNTISELMLFCEKYGINIDDVRATEGINIEFFIRVPEHSELKSEREFEMCGIYLANQFKSNATSMVEKLWKIVEDLSKLPRIKVTYTSTIGSKFTQDDSNKNIEEIKKEIRENSYFPFEEYQVY